MKFLRFLKKYIQINHNKDSKYNPGADYCRFERHFEGQTLPNKDYGDDIINLKPQSTS